MSTVKGYFWEITDPRTQRPETSRVMHPLEVIAEYRSQGAKILYDTELEVDESELDHNFAYHPPKPLLG